MCKRIVTFHHVCNHVRWETILCDLKAAQADGRQDPRSNSTDEFSWLSCLTQYFIRRRKGAKFHQVLTQRVQERTMCQKCERSHNRRRRMRERRQLEDQQTEAQTNRQTSLQLPRQASFESIDLHEESPTGPNRSDEQLDEVPHQYPRGPRSNMVYRPDGLGENEPMREEHRQDWINYFKNVPVDSLSEIGTVSPIFGERRQDYTNNFRNAPLDSPSKMKHKSAKPPTGIRRKPVPPALQVPKAVVTRSIRFTMQEEEYESQGMAFPSASRPAPPEFEPPEPAILRRAGVTPPILSPQPLRRGPDMAAWLRGRISRSSLQSKSSVELEEMDQGDFHRAYDKYGRLIRLPRGSPVARASFQSNRSVEVKEINDDDDDDQYGEQKRFPRYRGYSPRIRSRSNLTGWPVAKEFFQSGSIVDNEDLDDDDQYGDQTPIMRPASGLSGETSHWTSFPYTQACPVVPQLKLGTPFTADQASFAPLTYRFSGENQWNRTEEEREQGYQRPRPMPNVNNLMGGRSALTFQQFKPNPPPVLRRKYGRLNLREEFLKGEVKAIEIVSSVAD